MFLFKPYFLGQYNSNLEELIYLITDFCTIIKVWKRENNSICWGFFLLMLVQTVGGPNLTDPDVLCFKHVASHLKHTHLLSDDTFFLGVLTLKTLWFIELDFSSAYDVAVFNLVKALKWYCRCLLQRLYLQLK